MICDLRRRKVKGKEEEKNKVENLKNNEVKEESVWLSYNWRKKERGGRNGRANKTDALEFRLVKSIPRGSWRWKNHSIYTWLERAKAFLRRRGLCGKAVNCKQSRLGLFETMLMSSRFITKATINNKEVSTMTKVKGGISTYDPLKRKKVVAILKVPNTYSTPLITNQDNKIHHWQGIFSPTTTNIHNVIHLGPIIILCFP